MSLTFKKQAASPWTNFTESTLKNIAYMLFVSITAALLPDSRVRHLVRDKTLGCSLFRLGTLYSIHYIWSIDISLNVTVHQAREIQKALPWWITKSVQEKCNILFLFMRSFAVSCFVYVMWSESNLEAACLFSIHKLTF